MKIIYVNCGWRREYESDLRRIITTWAVMKIRPEKNSGLYGILIHDLCNTGTVLYQLS